MSEAQHIPLHQLMAALHDLIEHAPCGELSGDINWTQDTDMDTRKTKYDVDFHIMWTDTDGSPSDITLIMVALQDGFMERPKK
jgi:hypothetical protein